MMNATCGCPIANVLAIPAIAAIAGIASTLAMGQPQVAFIIGLVAVAFFSRIGC